MWCWYGNNTTDAYIVSVDLSLNQLTFDFWHIGGVSAYNPRPQRDKQQQQLHRTRYIRLDDVTEQRHWCCWWLISLDPASFFIFKIHLIPATIALTLHTKWRVIYYTVPWMVIIYLHIFFKKIIISFGFSALFTNGLPLATDCQHLIIRYKGETGMRNR